MVKEGDGILNSQSLLTLRLYLHGYQKHWIFGRRGGVVSLLRGGSKRGAHPLPPQDDLRISNTTANL